MSQPAATSPVSPGLARSRGSTEVCTASQVRDSSHACPQYSCGFPHHARGANCLHRLEDPGVLRTPIPSVHAGSEDRPQSERAPGGIQAPCKSICFRGRRTHRSLHSVARIARFARYGDGQEARVVDLGLVEDARLDVRGNRDAALPTSSPRRWRSEMRRGASTVAAARGFERWAAVMIHCRSGVTASLS
jgi:hypothetical protein